MIPLLFVFMLPFLMAFKPAAITIDQAGLSSDASEKHAGKADVVSSSPLHETGQEAKPSSLLSPPASSAREHPRPLSGRHPKDDPREKIYLLLDTSQHRLFVKRGERILHTAIASTGKGSVLIDPRDPDKVWIFETPKGRFTIQSKLEDPVWVRPDWAFIERGDPVPHNDEDRLVPGVLGSYALGFGDGYFIHGALYLNLLGQDVTHGCIQLHPDDLQFIYDSVPLGTTLIVV